MTIQNHKNEVLFVAKKEIIASLSLHWRRVRSVYKLHPFDLLTPLNPMFFGTRDSKSD